MKLKRFFVGIGIALALLVAYGVYELSVFSIFDEDFKVIETISVPNKNYLLKVYYIPSNATSQSYIQVRKIENGIEEVLESYERYNYLESFEIMKNDTINLTISDTSQLNTVNKEVRIKLP